MICYIALFYQKETSKSLKISEIPEESLKKYVTTKSDKKQDISKSKFDEKFLILIYFFMKIYLLYNKNWYYQKFMI